MDIVANTNSEAKSGTNRLPLIDEELFMKFVSKLGKDTFSYLPAMIIPAGLGIIGVMIFTRIFMPDAYGQYALVMAAVVFLTSLLSSWIEQSVLRYLPGFREKQRLPEFMTSLMVILLIIVLGFSIISIFIYSFLKSSLGSYWRFYFYGVLLIIVGILFRNFNIAFQANLQAKKYAKYQVIYAIGQLLLALIFVLFIAKDVIGLFIGAIASYFILITPMAKELRLFAYRRSLSQSFDFLLLKKFALYGFPMVGWFIGAQILAISDRFIIGAFKGPDQVGIYASNYSLVSQGIGLVSWAILMAAHPLIMNAWEGENKERMPEIVATFSRYFLLAVIPFMAYVSVFSQEIVTVLLGKAYQQGHVIIPIILAGIFAWHFAMYGQKGLEIMEKTQILLVLVMICAAANIILNLLFIPSYGYLGAAITTLLSYLLYPLLIYRATNAHMRWRIPWRSVANATLSSIAIVGLFLVLKFFLGDKPNAILLLVVGGAIALPIYFGLLYILKEVKNYEIRYLKSKAAKLGIISQR